MKIIEKSLSMALELFPGEYNSSERYRTYHFCFAWKRQKLLSIGINQPHERSPKAIEFGRKFRIEQYIQYPFVHAEIDCIRKLWGNYYIDNKLKLVVIRLNRNLKLGNSKPCKACSKVLSALNIDKIWYSDKTGKVVCASEFDKS